MGFGAWCWLAAGICLFGCSGDYPLAPTLCDDYCHVTKDLQCGLFYDPASCVSQCERDRKGDEACRGPLNDLLSCFEQQNAAEKRCRAYESYPFNVADAALCEAQINQLEICSSSLRVAADQPPGNR